MNRRTAVELVLALAMIATGAAFARPALSMADEAQIDALSNGAFIVLIAGFVIFGAGVSYVPREAVAGELRLPWGLRVAYVILVIVLAISVWTWWVPNGVE